MNKYREQSEEEICKGCEFLPTKPEAVRSEIAQFVAVASELSEIERGGGTFAYPDALSPLEWVCLRGLTRGKSRADELERERKRHEERIKRRKETLQNG